MRHLTMAQEIPKLPEVRATSSRSRRAVPPAQLLPTLFFLLLAVFLIYLRQFRFDTIQVLGVSMEPWIRDGDHLVAQRDAYDHGRNVPGRGDVVVVDVKDEGSTIIKRVIGLPGEWVGWNGEQVVVNGEPILEPYLHEGMADPPWFWKVPEKAVWVMGDNRNLSKDSRDYGPITADRVRGKVVWRIWPPRRAGAI